MKKVPYPSALRLFAFLTLLLSIGFYPERAWSEPTEPPAIKVSPPRIILGTLPYGDQASKPLLFTIFIKHLNTNVSVTTIDLSHSQGISVTSKRNGKDSMELNFEADPQKLSKSERFGAYITRDIRIETDSEIQPQIVIPVIGWIGINNSPRNFSEFVFRGVERWRGIWPTPNIAGAMLAATSILLIGSIGVLNSNNSNRTRNLKFLFQCVSTSIAIPVLILLALTYSRGAWIAYLAGILILIAYGSTMRKVAFLSLIGFITIVFFLPHGAQRFQSYAEVNEDLSIANRLKLWKGALQIMAEHPFTGVGTGHFQPIFEHDYQGFDYTAKTSTPVSDYLTLGTEHGIVALALVVGFLLFLANQSLITLRRSDEPTRTILTAVLGSMMAASFFSTLCEALQYRWFSSLVMASLFVFILRSLNNSNDIRIQGFSYLLSLSKFTIVSLCILLLIAAASLTLLPTRCFTQEVILADGSPFKTQVVAPRWKASHGIIFYLADSGSEELLYHSTIRPMATMGWLVISLDSSIPPQKLHLLVNEFHRAYPATNIYVAGDTRGGIAAWKAVATESPFEIEAGAGFNFLSMDLEERNGCPGPKRPFLVYQPLYAQGELSNPAICAQRQSAFKGLPLTVVLSEKFSGHFSNEWMNYLASLNNFFLSHNQRKS